MSWKKVAFWAKFLYLLCTRTFVLGIEEPDGDFLVKRAFTALLFAAFLSGSQSSDGVWNVGLRYGLILTAPHGPGFLRGRLEYAVDAVPIFWVLQKTNTAYGVGVNPFAFKWALDTRRNVVPYFEIGGGTLFTNVQVPSGTSKVNFTTSAALGLHFLRDKHNISAEVRYMHISNAGLATPNPGINTIQFRLGFGLFSQKE